jgi:hypothetical protein
VRNVLKVRYVDRSIDFLKFWHRINKQTFDKPQNSIICVDLYAAIDAPRLNIRENLCIKHGF